MREITGPIPCVLCECKVTNDEMAKVNDKYICRACIMDMVEDDSVLVKTKGGE